MGCVCYCVCQHPCSALSGPTLAHSAGTTISESRRFGRGNWAASRFVRAVLFQLSYPPVPDPVYPGAGVAASRSTSSAA